MFWQCYHFSGKGPWIDFWGGSWFSLFTEWKIQRFQNLGAGHLIQDTHLFLRQRTYQISEGHLSHLYTEVMFSALMQLMKTLTPKWTDCFKKKKKRSVCISGQRCQKNIYAFISLKQPKATWFTFTSCHSSCQFYPFLLLPHKQNSLKLPLPMTRYHSPIMSCWAPAVFWED